MPDNAPALQPEAPKRASAAQACFDHLVLGAESLPAGAAAVAQAFGVQLAAGGKHARMGTHNALLRLGEDAYLEVIAVDPDAPSPGRPRWFGLDTPSTQARLRQGPCLLTFVARVASTPLPALPLAVGPWEDFERNGLSWQLSVPADGALPADGVFPSLIAWKAGPHPSQRLPQAGCRLLSLRAQHPTAAPLVQQGLDALGLPFRCTLGDVPRLTVVLSTPAGVRRLHSDGPLAASAAAGAP